jgi:hypothetical protein
MRQLIGNPGRVLFGVAEEARIGAILLSESRCHTGVRKVIDLVRTGFEHDTVHDARHVACLAPASFRAGSVMGMSFRTILELFMTLQAPLIGMIQELKRCGIRGGVHRMRIMAAGAARRALAIAS